MVIIALGIGMASCENALDQTGWLASYITIVYSYMYQINFTASYIIFSVAKLAKVNEVLT